MARKQRAVIIDSCGDDHGDLLRLGRKGSRYFIERIGEAHTPQAGSVSRSYMPKAVAAEHFAEGCEYLGI